MQYQHDIAKSERKLILHTAKAEKDILVLEWEKTYGAMNYLKAH